MGSKLYKFLCLAGLAGLVVVGLALYRVITPNQLKQVTYTNSSGKLSFLFYSKHSIKKLSSGGTLLVSKASEAGRFPLTMVVEPISAATFNKYKDCNASQPKVMDTQNDNFNQTISVCLVSSGSGQVGVYVAAFTANQKSELATFSQDTSGANLSSPSTAAQSLSKFGIDVYQDDIRSILASIKTE